MLSDGMDLIMSIVFRMGYCHEVVDLEGQGGHFRLTHPLLISGSLSCLAFLHKLNVIINLRLVVCGY